MKLREGRIRYITLFLQNLDFIAVHRGYALNWFVASMIIEVKGDAEKQKTRKMQGLLSLN